MTAHQVSRLPEGSRLLHIGPHKTGTTTVQHAFHQNRDQVEEQGVHYAGKKAHSMTAAMAAASGKALATNASDGTAHWTRLMKDVQGSVQPRVVISSEFYCEADDEHARAIVDALGSGTHVVVTLRPLAKIMASQWQQYMQNQLVVSYVDWLDAQLNRPDDTHVTPSFWLRHRHDRLVRRWAEVVGPDRVTVVVVAEGDNRMLLDTFESMLDLRPHTLTPHDALSNRSLTHVETEMLRRFNERFRDEGWTTQDYTRFVRFGAVRHLQERRPSPNEARVLTPAWAAERASRLASEMAENIGSSGVNVVGDLSSLGDLLPDSMIGDNEPFVDLPLDVAARFATGLVLHLADVPLGPASGSRSTGPIEDSLRRRRRRRQRPSGRGRPPRTVEDLPVSELARTVGRRTVARLFPRASHR